MSPSLTHLTLAALTARAPCPAIPGLVPEPLRPTAVNRLVPAQPLPGLPTGCLQGLIDALDIGVLVCDERGRLLLANAAARRELASGGVLQLTADSALDVCGGAGLLLLRRAVHAAARARAYQLVPLRRGERRLMVSVQPLRAADDAPPGALLLLGRRQLCPELAVQELGRLYGLTSAERRVLASLLAGMPVAAMARDRGVAVSTVRTQVAALRAKFGVRRIDDITRLVAELPPMQGALPGIDVAPAAAATAAASATPATPAAPAAPAATTDPTAPVACAAQAGRAARSTHAAGGAGGFGALHR